MTESDAGLDAGAMRTTARRTGDGWVVAGSKIYIANVLGCHFDILLGRVTSEDPGGIAAWLVCRTPAGRLGTPADVGGICVYVASDAGRFHFGDEIKVDGVFSVA
jgi:alkylation response protein AidB-like acyl-CoA dehydrogenase